MNRLCVGAMIVTLAACGGGSAAPTQTTQPPSNPGGNPVPTGSATISISGSDDGYGSQTYQFSPGSVTITKGGTGTWTNGSGATHNLAFTVAGGTAPAALSTANGGSGQRTFPNAGAYTFTCTLHNGMQGTVNVQ